MITPSFGLTATERVLPRLALDWTTGLPQAGVDVSRAGVATFVGSDGLIQSASANTQRIDYSTGIPALLVEELKTNLLLNSLIDGTNLATQSVTVTAAAHTLSFYGTGSVALTGAHTATVNGLGAYPTRTTLTFTPTAGSLTLTVTGDVKFANLTLGTFATSFIPTDGTTKTRNADVATMTGTNFSNWYNASEGALSVWFVKNATFNFQQVANVSNNTSAAFMAFGHGSGAPNTNLRFDVTDTTSQASMTIATATAIGTLYKAVAAYKLNLLAAAANGSTPVTDTSATIPTVDRLYIGSRYDGTSGYLNGTIQKIMYWPQRLTNAEVQAFSK
jgi:hypothetical protein